MKTQWHPPFVALMKLSLGDYYDVDAEVSVGDLPRSADLVLIRREKADPPFSGLWMHLTEWNLFEFKGPTDHPDDDDLELLMHIGSGLRCRYNEEHREDRAARLPNSRFSYWYVVPSLGDTFFGRAQQRTLFDAEGGGLWRGRSWGHPIFLLNYSQADPGQLDALPLNVLRPNLGTPPAMRDLLLSRTDVLLRFAPLLFRFQPDLWEALKTMAQTNDIVDWEKVARVATPDLDKLAPHFPTAELIQAVGEDKVIQTLGEEHLFKKLLERLTPEQVAALIKQQQGNG